MHRSVVVSAGLLRIFGQEVAELPLVATSREYQGKVSTFALFLKDAMVYMLMLLPPFPLPLSSCNITCLLRIIF